MLSNAETDARRRQRRLYAQPAYPVAFLGLLTAGLLLIAGHWVFAVCLSGFAFCFYRQAAKQADAAAQDV